MKLIYYFAFTFFIFISCSSPTDRAYDSDNLEKDMVEVKKSLSEEDFNLLAGYIALLKLGEVFDSTSTSTLGKTYGDILDDAQTWKMEMEKQQAEEKALADKARKDELDRTKRLNESLTVSIYEKGFNTYSYQDYITLKFALENKSDKKIRAFTGVIHFNDLFDKEIQKVSLTVDDPIPAMDRITYTATLDYNQFDDEDVRLRSKELDDLKIVWSPKKIIFEDGSALE